MERLERYKDRPWELQSREAAGNPFLALLIVSIAAGALLPNMLIDPLGYSLLFIGGERRSGQCFK